jgi:hypothetical protein
MENLAGNTLAAASDGAMVSWQSGDGAYPGIALTRGCGRAKSGDFTVIGALG